MRRRPQDGSSSSDAADTGNSGSSGSSAGSSKQGPAQGPYECSKWVQEELGWHTDLPIGDPVSGMAWEHNGVDSGSYNLTSQWSVREEDVHPPAI